MIDTASMTPIAAVAVGPVWDYEAMQSEYTTATYNLALSPDEKRLYVTYGVQTVARGVGGLPYGYFITDEQGTPWLVTGGYQAVSVIDIDPNSPTYETELARITVPAGAQDVVFSPDGRRAYVTAWDGKTVTVIDTEQYRDRNVHHRRRQHG